VNFEHGNRNYTLYEVRIKSVLFLFDLIKVLSPIVCKGDKSNKINIRWETAKFSYCRRNAVCLNDFIQRPMFALSKLQVLDIPLWKMLVTRIFSAERVRTRNIQLRILHK